ncbi:hypothetical protein [Shewanella sp. OMA3-2]|uniref:hypothetical protein n=1 Tax=Shewanella sp. OMA3-2 TaxID=2908650 RepID=UPI001F2EF956|nr:hypothetical protein [Shewanella sp. OMA3-2]UJF22367.1 hypothetical protein L0B17_02775 [Shewanella sp. OMA3-2]
MTQLWLSPRLKSAVIIILCIIAVIASIQTTGLTRALIELIAFGSLIWLALSKPDIKQHDV